MLLGIVNIIKVRVVEGLLTSIPLLNFYLFFLTITLCLSYWIMLFFFFSKWFYSESTRLFIYLFFLSFCLFAISWAAPWAYGGSQARGLIRAVAASLRQSHSNSRSELRLRPTPQLTATPDH